MDFFNDHKGFERGKKMYNWEVSQAISIHKIWKYLQKGVYFKFSRT
jgi:hypothetical protein